MAKGLLTAALLIFALASPAVPQEIPRGVTYKRASDAVNAKAKAALEKALAEPGRIQPPFEGRTIVVGTIPFDVEEPFFTIDTGQKQFIVNLIPGGEGRLIVWIDLVGDVRSLKPQSK